MDLNDKDYKKSFGLAVWALTHARGLECDLCANQHEWDEHCDFVDGDCAHCKLNDCPCKHCNGITNFAFSVAKAEKMKARFEEDGV